MKKEIITKMIEDTGALDHEEGKFLYDVVIHNFYGYEIFTVRADGVESAGDKALKRMENEKGEDEYYSIDLIRIHKENGI